MFGYGRRGGCGGGWFGAGNGRGCGTGWGIGFSPAGMPRGTGRLIYTALAGGPKTEAEIKDFINKLTGYQISYSLEPILDFWTARGILKKGEDGKYELLMPANLGAWWI
ncbi:MAG: hypothetical protein ACP5NC_00735 [Nitrososphaeria archaeon]